MGTSMVLKDSGGRLGGYLYLENGQLGCRMNGEIRGERLTALFGDGREASFDLENSGAEQRFPCGETTLKGGWVSQGDRLLLASGAEAAQAWERKRILQRPKRPQTPREARKAEPGEPIPAAQPSEVMEQEKASAPSTREPMPQRRWPPPPCWPQAQYACGRWQEDYGERERQAACLHAAQCRD